MDKKLQAYLLKRIEHPVTITEKRKRTIHNSSKLKMDKETFCKIINLLDEADEASAILFDTGIDLGPHESRFYDIIETLLYQIFTERQLGMIHLYLFGESYIKDLPSPVDKKGNVVTPETPEQLWSLISNIE